MLYMLYIYTFSTYKNLNHNNILVFYMSNPGPDDPSDGNQIKYQNPCYLRQIVFSNKN